MTSAIFDGYESKAQNEHPAAFELCICGLPRWRHPPTEDDRKQVAYVTLHTEVPHHLFIRPALTDVEPTEKPGSLPQTPVAIDIEDALRCTAHIEDRGIRAAYIAQDLKIRGYVFTRRGKRGHFESVR